MAAGKYRTIVADPPWEYKSFVSLWPNGSKKAKRPLPYESMTLWEIGAVPLYDLADERGCNLFVILLQALPAGANICPHFPAQPHGLRRQCSPEALATRRAGFLQRTRRAAS